MLIHQCSCVKGLIYNVQLVLGACVIKESSRASLRHSVRGRTFKEHNCKAKLSIEAVYLIWLFYPVKDCLLILC